MKKLLQRKESKTRSYFELFLDTRKSDTTRTPNFTETRRLLMSLKHLHIRTELCINLGILIKWSKIDLLRKQIRCIQTILENNSCEEILVESVHKFRL